MTGEIDAKQFLKEYPACLIGKEVIIESSPNSGGTILYEGTFQGTTMFENVPMILLADAHHFNKAGIVYRNEIAKRDHAGHNPRGDYISSAVQLVKLETVLSIDILLDDRNEKYT
ncbi:MAG: hypothetical protein V1725_07180 [archaeon]